MAYEVHIVNPAPRKRRKSKSKNMAKKTHRRRAKKTTTAAAPRRSHARRRRVSTVSAAPRRRRRARAHNPGKKLRRRHRRSNPGLGLGIGSVMGVIKSAAPRMVGQLAVAAAVKFAERFGGKSAGGNMSTAYGEPLSWKQYLAGAAIALLAPKFVGRFVNAQQFQVGAIDYLLGKLVWTEGIARSQVATRFLGAPDGATYYDPDGQGWMSDGEQFNAMQGLVDAGPMDGLVDAGPMDGIADWGRSTNTDPFSR